MVILWNGLPAAHDTHNVSAIWFDRRTVCYTVGKDPYVHRASTHDIDKIVDAEYAATYRTV